MPAVLGLTAALGIAWWASGDAGELPAVSSVDEPVLSAGLEAPRHDVYLGFPARPQLRPLRIDVPPVTRRHRVVYRDVTASSSVAPERAADEGTAWRRSRGLPAAAPLESSGSLATAEESFVWQLAAVSPSFGSADPGLAAPPLELQGIEAPATPSSPASASPTQAAPKAPTPAREVARTPAPPKAAPLAVPVRSAGLAGSAPSLKVIPMSAAAPPHDDVAGEPASMRSVLLPVEIPPGLEHAPGLDDDRILVGQGGKPEDFVVTPPAGGFPPALGNGPEVPTGENIGKGKAAPDVPAPGRGPKLAFVPPGLDGADGPWNPRASAPSTDTTAVLAPEPATGALLALGLALFAAQRRRAQSSA